MARRTRVAVALCCLVPSLRASDVPPGLASLVETERAFARTSLERGQHAAFLAFFADDGIVFNPHPVAYKQEAAKRAPPTPPTSTLAWEPIFGDVSAAGDLGYTTGPFRTNDGSTAPRPPSYGYFFSIWRKQPDGSWKVALDLGIETPSQEADALRPRFQPAVHEGVPVLDPPVTPVRENLVERERRAATAAAAGLEGRLSSFDAAARLHRNGSEPVLGRDAIRAFLHAHPEPMSWTPLAGDVAVSGDLGYTYGSYQVQAHGHTQPSQRGYYVHVWRRAPDGEWRIVVDTTSPLPAEEETR